MSASHIVAGGFFLALVCAAMMLLAHAGRRPRMTAEQFERAYAERSGVSVEWLREQGRVVRPCDCGERGCEGWQSMGADEARELDDWRNDR